ncbi:MAG: hypothetical protein R3F20_03825 [Planctomycetota bacterium]
MMQNTWRTRASAVGSGPGLVRWAMGLVLLVLASPMTRAQEGELARAKWIWSAPDAATSRPTGERIFVRRAFRAPADASFHLEVTADNHFRAWIDGRPVLAGDDWAAPGTVEGRLGGEGEEHVLAVEAWNDAGAAGLIFALRIDGGAPSTRVVSDAGSLVASSGPDGWTAVGPVAGDWSPAAVAADFGGGPWGRPRAPRPPSFRPRPGFTVETVAEGVGSLIAMGRESDDRLWVSRESGGLLRLDRDAEGRFATGLELPAYSYAQGLAFAAGRLFLTGFGPQGLGLYSVDPVTGEGRRLARLEGAGEHGPHGIVVRGDRLWVTLGNHCRLMEPWAADSPYRGWYEGTILEAMPDPRGHANGILAPGGIIFSTDFEGTAFRVEAGGMRNVYDLAFDARGELFAFDADMEWDIGLPWYRPVRLYHVAPGAEFGWRQGSGKWPRAFADALPPVLEVGRGSPTGLVTYDGDSFPSAFRGAIFGADWSRGRILSFRVTPNGQGYLGRSETLLEGQPMNVTDLVVDGAGDLLFSCGGRGTRGGVFRLRYVGPGSEREERRSTGSWERAPRTARSSRSRSSGGASISPETGPPATSPRASSNAAAPSRRPTASVRDRSPEPKPIWPRCASIAAPAAPRPIAPPRS